MRGRQWTAGATFVVAMAAQLLVGSGCLGGDRDRPLGSSCSDEDECAEGLQCVYGRCRSACAFDRDCAPGEACVPAPGGGRVCTTEAEHGCGDDPDECPSGMVCDPVDEVCRQPCPCPEGYECVTREDREVCVDAPACTPDDPVCDLWPQCGCDAGQTCVPAPVVGGQRTCEPAGSTPHGGPCNSAADCEPGALCLGFETRLCLQLCNDNTDCEHQGPGSVCGGVPLATEGAVCTVDCDPLGDGSDCPAGTRCDLAYGVTPEWRWGTACHVGWGDGPAGTACATLPSSDVCGEGLACDGAGSCEILCNIETGQPCPAPMTCTEPSYEPWTPPVEIDGVSYGFCR